MSRIFLLSPANCSGPRATMVLSDRAQFDLALRHAERGGVAIGEVFAFVSGLYFKGKLAVCARVSRGRPSGARHWRSGALVINADGRPAPRRKRRSRWRPCVDSRASNSPRTTPRIRRPLVASARALDEEIGPECQVVLLGSSRRPNTGRADGSVGERLLFPIDFVGRRERRAGAGCCFGASRSARELSYRR